MRISCKEAAPTASKRRTSANILHRMAASDTTHDGCYCPWGPAVYATAALTRLDSTRTISIWFTGSARGHMDVSAPRSINGQRTSCARSCSTQRWHNAPASSRGSRSLRKQSLSCMRRARVVEDGRVPSEEGMPGHVQHMNLRTCLAVSHGLRHVMAYLEALHPLEHDHHRAAGLQLGETERIDLRTRRRTTRHERQRPRCGLSDALVGSSYGLVTV